MSRLFFTNIPCDCPEIELRQWVESHGLKVDSIRVVQDSVSGVSPAFGYVSLRGDRAEIDPVRLLNGQTLRGQILQVREDWRKAESSTDQVVPEINYVLTMDEISDLTKDSHKPAETLMNVVALSVGAIALVSIVTVYYVFLRKPAVKVEEPQPAQQQ